MDKHIEDIRHIRQMMEKSTKFLSLSGRAGIIAGVAAIAGAAFIYFYLLRDPSLTDFNIYQESLIILGVGLAVLLVALGAGLWLSHRKARRMGEKLLNKATLRTIYNLSIPLVAGGLFCFIFLMQGNLRVAVAGTLLFYGLALVNASKYTYSEIHYLGLTEILLGLVAALFARYGLLFWVLGFGVCHILYGSIMYYKYDRNRE